MKGLIHIYTGEGKGKTTAALGLAMRAAGRKRRVLIVQFLKGRASGEHPVLNTIPGISLLRLDKDYGFYYKMSDENKAAVRKLHDAMLSEAVSRMEAGELDLLILDEAIPAYCYNALDRERLMYCLEHKPEGLELVLTGRGAPEELIEYADYVTEMCKRKHPFDLGISAREGVEF